MNSIFCIGLGRLGLIFSQILANYDYFIYANDINKNIKKKINLNYPDPEPQLNKLINKNKSKFFFTDDFKRAIQESFCLFIVLPTPSKKNNEFDNSFILNCINKIGPHLKDKKKYLINITSTVNPGSCNFFIKKLENQFNLKHGNEFIITYNPHLIALGSIYNDVINSDLVIAGSDLPEGHSILKKIYKKIYKKKISKLKCLNLKEAEIAKISINAYITMKISFTNTISQIADVEKKIDTSKILDTIGFDKRIGHNYLKLGAMYSGPCFPRDNLNFSKYLCDLKLKNYLPITIDKINNIQLNRYIRIFKRHSKHLRKDPVIGICGLSYKDKTSLTTFSPGEQLIKKLHKKYKILYFDSYIKKHEKIANCKQIYNLKTFYNSCDIIFICYKDKKFKSLEKYISLRKKIVIDLWNFLKFKNKNITNIKIGIS